jgi:hypothetical protein
MFSKIFVFLSLLTATTLCQAQDSRLTEDDIPHKAMNGWYAEILGASLLGVTINYERYLSSKPGGLNVHAGAGVNYGYSDALGTTLSFTLPMGISYDLPTSSKHRSFVEIGGGYTFLIDKHGQYNYFYPLMGWRFLAKPRGLQYRVTLLPIIGGGKERIGPLVGFSIGKKF